jgi:methionine-rich copper-binding protein CopC
MRKCALLGALALLPVLAAAHTHLLESTPAANSTGRAPREFMLQFSEATRLTALTLQREGSPGAQKLAPLPEQAGKLVRLAAPQLAPGAYVLVWRAVADDGHVMSGTLRFTVAAP